MMGRDEGNDAMHSDKDTMGDFEMAVLAAQTRANLARLREYNGFQPADERALDDVDRLLSGILSDHAPASVRPPAPRRRSTPFAPGTATPARAPAPPPAATDPQQALAQKAAADLRAAHPRFTDRMTALMWMSMSGDTHIFKHSNTRRSLAFNAANGAVSCTVATGETSFDPATVFSEVGTL
jgi:hypothetical protein